MVTRKARKAREKQIKNSKNKKLIALVGVGLALTFPGHSTEAAVGTTYGAGAQATAESALAMGDGAAATDDQTTAVGENAQATAWHTTAMGANAEATVDSALAVGADAIANAIDTTALGSESEATAKNASAVGKAAVANQENGTALGTYSEASGEDSTAIGVGSAAKNKFTTAIGDNAQVTGFSSTGIGADIDVSGNDSVAIGVLASATEAETSVLGYQAKATAEGATAIGSNTVANAEGATTIGNRSKAMQGFDVAIGANAVANGDVDGDGKGATAIGAKSSATGAKSTAIGNRATATNGGIAIGYKANASAMGSVAIGDDSVADKKNTVSVGSATKTRTISHVTAGVDDTDAVNVSQLKEAIANINVNGQNIDWERINTTGSTVTNSYNSTVLGGEDNLIKNNTTNSDIIGGHGNTLDPNTDNSAIVAGTDNLVKGIDGSFIGGGVHNTVEDENSAIIGGTDNLVSEMGSAVVAGFKNTAEGEGSVVVGGHDNLAAGTYAVVMGGDNNTAEGDATAVLGGVNNQAIGEQSAVIGGSNNVASGHGSVVIGGNNGVASGENAIAMNEARATGKNTLAVGQFASAENENAVAIQGKATNKNTVAIGSGSQATGENAVALQGQATAINTLAFGTTAVASQENAIAIQGQATGENSIAIGRGSVASKNTSVAIGTLAQTTANGSVALGYQSVADEEFTVSVGSDEQTRKVTHVTAGVADTDAVNVSQLKEGISNVTNEFNTKLDGKANINLDNITNEGKTVIEDIAKSVDTNAKVTSKDKNLKVTDEKDGNVTTYDIALARDLDVDSLSVNGKTYITNMGINANSQKIANVAAGEVSKNSTDAVNGAQLYEVKQSIANIKSTGDVDLSNTANIDLTNISVEGEKVITDIAKSVDTTAVVEAGGDNIVVKAEKKDNTTTYTVNLADTIRANAFGVGDKIYISAEGLNANSQRITNVAAGVKDTDAVNVAQLNEAINKVTVNNKKGGDATTVVNETKNPLAVEYDSEKKDTVTLQGEGGTTITNVKAGDVSKASTDAVNGSQLYETNVNVEQNTKNIEQNTTEINELKDADELNVKYTDKTKTEVALAGNGGTRISNVADAINNDEAVNYGQLKEAISNINGGDAKNVVRYTDDSHKTAILDGEGGTSLTGVADGKIAKGSQDAINGGQLYDEQEARKKADEELSNRIGVLDETATYNYIKAGDSVSNNLAALDKAIDNAGLVKDDGNQITIAKNSSTNVINVAGKGGEARVITGVKTDASDGSSAANVDYVNQQTKSAKEYADGVGAQAAAMASLHPLDWDKKDKLSVAASAGVYKSSVAGAIGAFYRPYKKTMVSVQGAFGSAEGNMIGIGISKKFGKNETEEIDTEEAEALRNEMADLRSENSSLKDENEQIKAQNQQIMEQNRQIMEMLASLKGTIPAVTEAE